MLLKDHLKEIFIKASLENNTSVKENILIKWVHRFGFESLNDLLIQAPFLTDEDYEEEKQEQISLKLIGTSENLKETSFKINNGKIVNKNEISESNKNEYICEKKLPLPNITNLRKWINNDKKAS